MPFARVLWLSFTCVSLVVYLAGCVIVLVFQQRQTRVDLHYLLYAEAEALASYYAATGALDFPELEELDDDTPTPVWLRLVRGGEVLAATPEMPALVIDPFTGERWGELRLATTDAGEILVGVEHSVWNEPGTVVQAYSAKVLFDARLLRLGKTLALTALILLPLSLLVSRWLAGLVLRPVEKLMSSIAAMAPDDLSQRLEIDGRVREIEDLAREFNQLLARVESTLQRMRRFTANASHELRTPIASLRTGIEVCLRRSRTEDEYRQVLEESLQEIRRMHRSVETLLALAREQEESRAPRLGEVDLAEVVATAVIAVRPLLDEKELRLDLDLHPSRLLGDAGMLELMVVNLLDNAVRFSPGGGQVAVACRGDEAACTLRVSDQGPGVAPADGERIFSRHYQGGRGDDLPASARVGGIGLDLVRWVVEAHDGRVCLVPPAADPASGKAPSGVGPDPVRGATFEVELPANKLVARPSLSGTE